MVESCYWEKVNHGNHPDSGSFLDQDTHLDRDMRMYGWYLGLARNQVRKDKEDEAKIRR